MAIAQFQFLEEALKELILLYLGVIQSSVPKFMAYNFKENNIRKLSLGQSVSKLQVFLEDQDLLDELNDLVPKRNKIAHAAYVKYARLEPTIENYQEAMNEVGSVTNATKILLQKVQVLHANIVAQTKTS